MENDLKSILNSFTSLILIRIKKSDDIYQSPFIYESGSFENLGFKDYKNFDDLIFNIYHKAPICEGIGYYEYCNQINEGIMNCLDNGIPTSFFIPIRKENKTYYFIMNLNRNNEDMCASFLYFDDKSGLYNFEEFSSGTFKDGLTGLFNYRTLVSHISENKRRGYISLFDLNGFKQINDVYGHEVGDVVLKEIANYLISIATRKEVFYRRSGDEFMMLVFEQDLDYVLSLIKQINDHIVDIPNIIHKDFKVSAAFGILELILNDNEGYELESKLVDLAMYQAKKSNKLYHYISHDDAMNIIEKGDLDQRIKEIAHKIGR